MNQLTTEKRVAVLAALVEGNSIRATVRMTGVAKNTIVNLLAEVGEACMKYHDEKVRGLTSDRIQVDEIWSFVGCKEKTKKGGGRGDGDAWTWTAIDADSKLVVSYLVGKRDSGHATAFMEDIAARVANRIQLTSDGQRFYFRAVQDAFGNAIDYAMLEKYYGPPGEIKGQRTYSPPVCIGTRTMPMIGDPDPYHISTSYVERQNLTMRMSMRRFTRLTNAFSKKWENLEYACALHFMHYNFCRIHQSLRFTPAMAAGLSDHVWELADIVALLHTP